MLLLKVNRFIFLGFSSLPPAQDKIISATCSPDHNLRGKTSASPLPRYYSPKLSSPGVPTSFVAFWEIRKEYNDNQVHRNPEFAAWRNTTIIPRSYTWNRAFCPWHISETGINDQRWAGEHEGYSMLPLVEHISWIPSLFLRDTQSDSRHALIR